MHFLPLLALLGVIPPVWGNDIPMQIAVERFVYQSTKPNPAGTYDLDRVLDKKNALAVRCLQDNHYHARQLGISVLSDRTNKNAVRALIWGMMPEYKDAQGKFLCEYILFSFFACNECRGTGICQQCGGTQMIDNSWCMSCIVYRGQGTSPCGVCRGSGLPLDLAPQVLEQGIFK